MTADTPELQRYKKLSLALTSYFQGKGYYKALDAFEFAKERHQGFRKDKKTPTFQHQIEICLYIMTLKEVQFDEDTLCAALLHDVREDPTHDKEGNAIYVEHKEIKDKFGKRVADAVEKLTKEFKGVKKDTKTYFDIVATCPIASIVKLADRIHNVSSMVGVFTIPKQDDYVFEIKEYFLPMIKQARKNFPRQHMSYHAMGTFIKNMCKTVEAVLVAEKQVISLKSSMENIEPALEVSRSKHSM